MLVAFLLSVAAPLAAEPELRPHSQSEIGSKLGKCGIRHFTVRFDEDLQSDVIELADVQVTDDQMRCIFYATDHATSFVFWPQNALATRYHNIADQLRRPRVLARAQAYFDERPELGEPPRRVEGQSELDFARSIERFCGPDAQGFFAIEYGQLTVSSKWHEQNALTLGSDAFGCAYMASVLRRLEFGFIGND